MCCWFLIFIKNHETAIHTHLPYTLFTQCSFLGICWGDINILLDFWILLNLDLPCVRPNWQYKLLVQDYNSLRWYKTFWELFPFEVMWLCNKVTVFMSQNMNLWNVTVVTFLRLCVPRIFLSAWTKLLRISPISQKRYHLWNWNVHMLVLIDTSSFI